MTKKKVDDIFFQLFCEKNSDGTKHLRLHGRELYQRFGFRLKGDNMYELASFLHKDSKVSSLDLCYNEIGDTGLNILSKNYFGYANNMRHLNLLHCDIGADGLQGLSNGKYLNLRSLRLEGNKFGPAGARFIGDIINKCEDLEVLDIGETDQTNESIESLLIVVEKSRLQALNISRVLPSTFYSKYNSTHLAENIGILMKIGTSIQVLRIQKCELDGHDIELLVNGMKYHENLAMLDLGANKFGDHGIKYIAKWLRTRPVLTGLRIPANNITATGARNLAKSLPFSRIRFLDLQHNQIKKPGIIALLYSIKKSTPMRMFFIWGNEMGSKELQIIDRLLRAGVLEQEYIDVKIYKVDGVEYAAYYPSNKYALNSYSVPEFGFPPELKIIRNKIVDPTAKPRALVNFDFVARYPPAVPINENQQNEIRNKSVDTPDESSSTSAYILKQSFEDDYDDEFERLFV